MCILRAVQVIQCTSRFRENCNQALHAQDLWTWGSITLFHGRITWGASEKPDAQPTLLPIKFESENSGRRVTVFGSQQVCSKPENLLPLGVQRARLRVIPVCTDGSVVSPLRVAQNSRGMVSQQPILLPPFRLPKDHLAPNGNYQAMKENSAEAAGEAAKRATLGCRQLPLRFVTGNHPERVMRLLCSAAALPVRWLWQDLSGYRAPVPFRRRR